MECAQDEAMPGNQQVLFQVQAQSHIKVYGHVCPTTLYIMRKNRSQSENPASGEWVNELSYIINWDTMSALQQFLEDYLIISESIHYL